MSDQWSVTGPNGCLYQIGFGIVNENGSRIPIGCVYGDPQADDVRKAAAVCAAAPELLEALRPFANFACDEPCDCHNCRARAAIIKATGEQS